MPVIHNISLSLKTREVLRREGFREHSKVRPEISILILELLANVKKARLLEPAIAYEIYTIAEISQQQLSIEGKMVICDAFLPSLLPRAKELAVAMRPAVPSARVCPVYRSPSRGSGLN